MKLIPSSIIRLSRIVTEGTVARGPNLPGTMGRALASFLGGHVDSRVPPRQRDVNVAPLAAAKPLAPSPALPIQSATRRIVARVEAAQTVAIAPVIEPAVNMTEQFLEQRTSHLAYAVNLMQRHGAADHVALQQTIRAKNLNPEQAIQLEDALVRYGLNPDMRRAIDETSGEGLPSLMDDVDVSDIGHRASIAAGILSAESPSFVGLQNGAIRAEDVSLKSANPATVVPEKKTWEMTKEEGESYVGRLMLEMDAQHRSEKDFVPEHPTNETHVLLKSGATAIRHAYAFASQGAWQEDGLFGGTACTFISIENLKAMRSAKDGQVTPAQLSAAMKKGVENRAIFALSVKEKKEDIPVSFTSLKSDFVEVQFPEILPHPVRGPIITTAHIDQVVDRMMKESKNNIVIVNNMTIAVGRHEGQVTVFDSHGGHDVLQPKGHNCGYAVTFETTKEAAIFLKEKMAGMGVGAHPEAWSVEVYAEK